jgi:hypothetical protein
VPIRLYVAGPITGRADLNFPAFREAAGQLRVAGYEVTDPTEKEGDPHSRTWEEWMHLAIAELVACEALALLPGWWDSRGAKLEVMIARALAMPVKPLEQWLGGPHGT